MASLPRDGTTLDPNSTDLRTLFSYPPILELGIHSLGFGRVFVAICCKEMSHHIQVI